MNIEMIRLTQNKEKEKIAREILENIEIDEKLRKFSKEVLLNILIDSISIYYLDK